jgi:hypothetical protein
VLLINKEGVNESWRMRAAKRYIPRFGLAREPAPVKEHIGSLRSESVRTPLPPEHSR